MADKSGRADAAASLPQDGLEQLIADFEAAIAEPGGRQRGTCWTCGVDHDNEQRLNRAVIALTLRRLRHLRVKDAAASRAPSQVELITRWRDAAENYDDLAMSASSTGTNEPPYEASGMTGAKVYRKCADDLEALAAGACAAPSKENHEEESVSSGVGNMQSSAGTQGTTSKQVAACAVHETQEAEPCRCRQSMTVRDFIHWLESLRIPDAVVKAFDPESGQDEPVTGGLYDAEGISLRTDEP